MQFANSTQARSWMFNAKSLMACRRRAADVDVTKGEKTTVRKFASGYHRREGDSDFDGMEAPCLSEFNWTFNDQETLVQFHAHQLQTLVGPTALLRELRTSETVLSTAIMFFRRFFLSNSTAQINPRKIAVACAFLASKVEEEKVEIGLLAHATAIVRLKVQNAPLCRKALCALSVAEIEDAERTLMEGINYEFRCHHPTSNLYALSLDAAEFLSGEKSLLDERNPVSDGDSYHLEDSDVKEKAEDIFELASEIAQRALVFSDAPFLFTPDHVAHGILAFAIGSVDSDGKINDVMQEFLVHRFPLKGEEELLSFSRHIHAVIHLLLNSPMMDLRSTFLCAGEVVAMRAEELRRVLGKVASIRLVLDMRAQPTPTHDRKRTRLAMEFTPPRELFSRKMAKVTPTGNY